MSSLSYSSSSFVFVIVFFLSHAEYAEYAELPVLESLVHAALESAEGHLFHCACHAGCSANRSSAPRSPFILSPFSFLRSHRASRRDVVCDKFCAFHLFLQHLRCKYIGYLRILRILREIFIIPELNNSFFHAKSAKGAKFYFFSGITLALEWSQTSLRQECAKR